MEPTSWAGAVTAVAVTVGLITQVVLQLLARRQAQEAAATAAAVAVKAEQTAATVAEKVVEVKETAAKAVVKAEKAAERAAVKVDEVKRELQDATAGQNETLAGIAKSTADVHTLVNNNMLVALQLNAVTTRRLANLTREPADIEAADLAERLSREHEVKQAKVDARPT